MEVNTKDQTTAVIPKMRRTLYSTVIKRFFDIVLSLCALVLLSWLCLILYIAIKIDDPGPALFWQKRVGRKKNGEITYFRLAKFRSMKMSTPHDIPTHLLNNPEQYITKIGCFLRKSSLDELPQIVHILTGKMSIIGPRPALWNQDDLIAERDKYGANNITPGLTGWAQVNGRDKIDIADKARLDGEYAQHITLKLDWICFWMTVSNVLKSKGVIEGGTGTLMKQKNNQDEDVFIIENIDVKENEYAGK